MMKQKQQKLVIALHNDQNSKSIVQTATPKLKQQEHHRETTTKSEE